MTDTLQLEDLIQVKLPSVLEELTDAQEQELNDYVKSHGGLTVTFDLSHSAKRINNRIYQPWAQKAGASTWNDKAVIKHHDLLQDAQGRVTEVQYVDTPTEAIAWLGSVSAYNEVVAAFDTRDRKTIHNVFNKYQLYKKGWPGLGKLVAKAKISDPDAIQKFKDKRFLNFSGGGFSDRIECSKCGKRLTKNSFCKHEPGAATEDGDFSFLLTNTYEGREVSVVNQPADDAARVTHLAFEDMADNELESAIFTIEDSEAWEFVDSEIDFKFKQEDEPMSSTVIDYSDRLDKLEGILSSMQDIIKDFKPTVTEPIIDSVVKPDWFLLDLALDALVSVKLTKEEREVLTDADFIGPDRKFPIANSKYVEAARILFDSYEGPGDKSEILSQINEKSESFKIVDIESLTQKLNDSITLQTDLRKDYTQALQTIEKREAQLIKLVDELAKIKNISIEDNIVLDEKIEMLDTIQVENNILTPGQIATIDNPTGVENQQNASTSLNDLSGFQRNIVKRYSSLTRTDGAASAEAYLNRMKANGNIDDSFNITQYLN